MKIKKLFTCLSLCFLLGACGSNTKSNNKENVNPGKKDPEIKDPEKIETPDPLPNDFDYASFEATPAPFGINVSYYSDIYSRGFAWFTDNTVSDTKLYLVESGKGKNADFSNAELISGTTLTATYSGNGEGFSCTDPAYETKSASGASVVVNSHKAHKENLKKNTTYSYKIGSESGWAYGAFTTEKEEIEKITAIQLSDAQTYHTSLLTTYRSTLQQAISKAGSDLDTILYNGDMFDQNMEKVDSQKVNNILRYTKAQDATFDLRSSYPFMTSAGNHETKCPYSQILGSDINYGAFDYKGGNYSYDYGFAHFIVLNSNRLADDDLTDEDYVTEMNWLTNDLASQACQNAKWKIVMMHIACYSTGDHSNEADNQRLVERLTPLFSQNHIDLVLQAHDHTYNKTLPYKWDAAGYSTTYDNASVVSFNPQTVTIEGRTYDSNPNGTYYVTTGAAGHRAGSGGKDGAHEYEDGIWAEVTVDGSGNIQPAYTSKTYRNNKYKCEVGKFNISSILDPWTTSKSITVDANYQVGDPATACADGQMFGVLNLTKDALTYDSYLIKTGTTTPSLFDTLSVYKNAQ